LADAAVQAGERQALVVTFAGLAVVAAEPVSALAAVVTAAVLGAYAAVVARKGGALVDVDFAVGASVPVSACHANIAVQAVLTDPTVLARSRRTFVYFGVAKLATPPTLAVASE
jgi:hypothetical protein